MFPFLGISITLFSVTSSSLVQRQAQISNNRILPATFNLPNPTASTVLPETSLPPASLPILPTSPFNVSSNVTNVLNTTEAYLRCSYALGQGLTIDSCIQAQSELRTWLDGLTRSYITIGQPTYGVWDVDDRITFLSSDRICAFDFWVLPGGEDGQVATYDLAHASNQLMLRCVTHPGGIAGGSYGNIGVDENVVMEVQYEQPFPNLQCANAQPAGPPTASCFALRNSIPKAGDAQTFGSLGENVDVVLPLRLASADGSCALTIFTTGPSDSLTWYKIYKAATEIEAACVRRGRRGMVHGLGQYEHLQIMLTKPSEPVPGLATNSSTNYTSSF